MGDGVERAQHIETLSPRWGLDEDTGQRPEEAQERSEHKMGSIHKENCALTCFGFREARLHFLFEVSGLHLWIGFRRDHADFPATEMEFFFKNSRTWVSLRLMPVKASISLCASLILAGGLSRK